MCFLCRCYVLSLIYAAIRVQVLAYSEPTESGFQPTQTCSHAVIQNPNCTLLDVDDTVGQSNVDWLTGGLENGKDLTAGFTENGRNTKKKLSRIKKKYSKKSADSGYSRYLSLFLTLGLTSALCYECYSLFILFHGPERGCTTYFLYCPHLAVNTLCVEMSSQKLPMNNVPITRTLE